MKFFGYKDVTESLSFLWSSVILLVFALFIGFLRYWSLPSLISCWTPSQFTATHQIYVLQTCWEKNTTYFPIEEKIPVNFEKPQEVIHTWIPILLICLIIGFKIPEFVKKLLDVCTGTKSGLSIASTASWNERVEYLAQYGQDIVKRSGMVKTLSFFLIKILILANLLVQFIYVRTYFRDTEQTVMRNNNTFVTRNIIFPKTILCDFSIRQLQTVQRYTVQCSMSVNYLYEGFFRLYSFWILIVGLFTGAVFLFQFATLLVPSLVGIRFRGIIPDKELNLRGFVVDDVLLFLEDVKNEFGVGMARNVASKIFALSPKMAQIETTPALETVAGDGFRELPMRNVDNDALNSRDSPLLDARATEKI